MSLASAGLKTERVFAIIAVGAFSFLLVAVYRTSFRRAHTSDLIGKYAQRPGLFVSAPHLPSTLRFGSDDTLATSGSSGVADLQLRWTLDSVEDVIRVANSEWDRRIRVRPTWTGFVLEMRIDDSAHHSSDGTSRAEEMEFRRTD